MAIREIREIGDEILTKQCKDVAKMTFRTKILIGDMLDTMLRRWESDLRRLRSAFLKKIVVIDVEEGPIVLVNSTDHRNERGADRRGRVFGKCSWKMGDRDTAGTCKGAVLSE